VKAQLQQLIMAANNNNNNNNNKQLVFDNLFQFLVVIKLPV
jgi:hypothetical protein